MSKSLNDLTHKISGILNEWRQAVHAGSEASRYDVARKIVTAMGDASARKDDANLTIEPHKLNNARTLNQETDKVGSPEFEAWWAKNGVMSEDSVLRIYYKELQWEAWNQRPSELPSQTLNDCRAAFEAHFGTKDQYSVKAEYHERLEGWTAAWNYERREIRGDEVVAILKQNGLTQGDANIARIALGPYLSQPVRESGEAKGLLRIANTFKDFAMKYHYMEIIGHKKGEYGEKIEPKDSNCLFIGLTEIEGGS